MEIRFDAVKYFQIFFSVFFVGSYLKFSTVIDDKYKYKRFLSETWLSGFVFIPKRNKILLSKNWSDLFSSLNKSKFICACSVFLFNIKQ